MVKTKWPETRRPFQRIHLDLFHFDNQNLLIIVDSFSKFMDVRILKGTKASDIIEHTESFFAYFGKAEEVVTDNGPPFNSENFTLFLESYGVKVKKSPPYHPQSNGLAERGVRTVKEVFKKYLIDQRFKALTLQRKVNKFLSNFRNSPCTITNATPAEKILCYVPHTRIGKVNPMKLEVKEKIPQFRRQTVEEIKRCQKKVEF